MGYLIISILPEQLKKLGRDGLQSPLRAFSLLIRPLLITGVFVFALIFACSPSQTPQVTSELPSQSLFVQSQRTSVVPPPLRIVEGSVLQSNRTPTVVEPQTLGAVSSQNQRTGITKYTVESGDTVTSVADQFSLNVDTILWANDLTRNSTLQPGDELVILSVDGFLYSVRQGDTVSGIAQTYDTEAEKIVSYNELENKSDIYTGDTLILPGGEKPDSIFAAQQTSVGDTFFSYPCQGVITQSNHGPLNNAVDIANNCGSPVVASAGGTVKRAGRVGIGGKRVTIEHPNGVVTYYGHLSEILVVPGQRVSKGTLLGKVGNTGFTIGATGCHVHYAVSGTYNPLSGYPVGGKISW